MKSVFVESKKKSAVTLAKLHPTAKIVDVTSHATDEFVRFSPFYPLRGIPIPFSEPRTAKCVEGVWQGLKVFGRADISTGCFANDTMKDLKRTVRRYGNPRGHRKGVDGKELLGYIEARIEIYLPTYRWALDHRLQPELRKLRAFLETQDLILLDYETNGDVFDPSKPLSHAHLIKAYLEGRYDQLSSRG